MSSVKEEIVDSLEAFEAAYAAVTAMPIHALLPSEQRALASRLEAVDKKIAAFNLRLRGRLISQRGR